MPDQGGLDVPFAGIGEGRGGDGPALPLHRSLWRALVLATLASGLSVAAYVLLLWTGDCYPFDDPFPAIDTQFLQALAADRAWLVALLALLAASSAWFGALVVAGDLAVGGSRVRRVVVCVLAPVALPVPLLSLFLGLQRALHGGGVGTGPEGWGWPWAEALQTLGKVWQGPGPWLMRAALPSPAGIVLCSLLPFTALLWSRARPRRRPLWLHVLVVLVTAYAALLMFDGTGCELDPLRDARWVFLGGSGAGLLLVGAEAALAAARRPGLRALAGASPPRGRGALRDVLVVGLGAGLATASVAWVYPAHYLARAEARARRGEKQGFYQLWSGGVDAETLLEEATRWPAPAGRAMAYRLAGRFAGLRGIEWVRTVRLRAREDLRSDPEATVRAAAAALIHDEREALLAALEDPSSEVRLAARLGLAIHGERPLLAAELVALLRASQPGERARLLTQLRWNQTAVGRPYPDLGAALLVLAAWGDLTVWDGAEVDHVLPVSRVLALVTCDLRSDQSLPPPSPELFAILRQALEGADRHGLPKELLALLGEQPPPPRGFVF
jgi:hypothetical protein